MSSIPSAGEVVKLEQTRNASRFSTIRQMVSNPVVFIAVALLAVTILSAVFAPLLARQDPFVVDTLQRFKPASAEHWFGTDSYGRDLFARVIYGTRVSLLVGVAAAAFSVAIGTGIGLVAGFVRAFDAVVMRVVDGLMAMPSILLAITIVAIFGASFWTVLVAITVAEVPRVIRLVRAVVLSAREEPYIEAAISLGSSLPRILWRHLIPNAVAPLIVQGSYICASAILTESILSFLGAGIDPTIPTWGNIMADGRSFFQLKPTLIFWPSLFISLTILSINIIGDATRDQLDPKMTKRAFDQ